MVISMMAIGSMESIKERESIFIVQVRFMKEIGIIISSMAKGY
jgi:hypothetical protein